MLFRSEEERAALAARLNAFLKATEKNYLDGIVDNLIHPMLTKIVGDKPKLLILNKADLADSNRTKEWRSYFESQGIKTLAINSKEQSTVKLVTDAAKSLMADKIQRLRERSIQKETLRTMIIGIPNAGKSTLMNRLAGKKIAVVGNKPGDRKSTRLNSSHIPLSRMLSSA